MMSSNLFQPVTIGSFNLGSRLVYAPLTRNRAIDNVPQPCMEKYYAQRAHKGLMVTEATVISPEARGYPHTPGIYTEEQINAWKPIVKATKEKGATFFCQIWHCGRASLPDYQPNKKTPIGPSAIAVGGKNECYSPDQNKMVPYGVPRALELHEIKPIVEQFAEAAKNAIEAGFDGIEIHGANGYLPDQFLKQSSNQRTDEYGGSQENRCRFMLEVVEAVANAVGGNRVGLRLSPYNFSFLDCQEPDTISTMNLNVYLLQQVKKYDLAYVHLVSSGVAGNTENDDKEAMKQQTLEPFRHAYNGKIIAAGGYIKDSAEKEVDSGYADLVAFGRWWIANPDFPERLKSDKPFNKYNRDLFYSQEPVKGYTDYPYLNEIPEETPTSKHYSGATVYDTQN